MAKRGTPIVKRAVGNLHVLPNEKGSWSLARTIATFSTQAKAIEAAKKRRIKVIIHDSDGGIRVESSNVKEQQQRA